MQTPLKVVELSKDFNDKNAVKNISFEVKENEISWNSWPEWLWKNHNHRNDFRIIKTFKWKSANK